MEKIIFFSNGLGIAFGKNTGTSNFSSLEVYLPITFSEIYSVQTNCSIATSEFIQSGTGSVRGYSKGWVANPSTCSITIATYSTVYYLVLGKN